MLKEFEQLSERLEALSRLTGTGCIWKFTSNCFAEPRLPRSLHDFPFCRAAKLRHESRCVFNDTVELTAELERSPKPFLHRCHAGAFELAVPVMRGERVLGVVLCGPFRAAEAAAAYPECREAFAALPVWNPELAGALAVLARELAAGPALEAYASRPELRLDSRCDRRILEVLEFMAGHFREPLALTRAAERVFLSPSRLSHLFRRECGTSFSGYLLELRILAARRLLTGTDLPVGEVASRCGFTDPDYFSAQFRRRTGESPTGCRRRRPGIPV